MKRRIRTIVCCTFAVILIMFTSVEGFADSIKIEQQNHESTERTQEQYYREIARAPQSEKAVATCKAFIAICRASVRDTHYNPKELICHDQLSNLKILYRLSEYEYLSTLYQKLNQKIITDNISFYVLSVKQNNDSGEVEIVESYSYTIDDGSDGECFRKRKYDISLKHCEGKWLIDDITTDDPWENDAEFNYSPIDVPLAIKGICNDSMPKQADLSEAEQVAIGNKSVSSTNSTLYIWNYYPDVAVSYAAQYYNSSNLLFGTASSDCQNFASQCVWAGLRQGYVGASSYTGIPAVSTSLVGATSANVWCHNQASTHFSSAYLNYSWDNACGFAELMKRSTNTQVGPFGNTIYGNLKYAHKGDVISWDSNGAPSGSSIDHAMFVTKVSGTVGSRTRSNIWIAAHNSPTNSAYMALTSYASYADSYYATSVISCGYYNSPQVTG